jgi:hypothetical protein
MINAVFRDVTLCEFLITDVSEKHIASEIKETSIGDLGTTLATINN